MFGIPWVEEMLRQTNALRTYLSVALDPEMRQEGGLSRTNQAVVAIIVLSILLGVIETEPALATGYEHGYQFAHAGFFLIFLAEYFARLYAAPINPKYHTPLHYAVTFSALLDLVVLVSFILPFFGLEATLLRMFRVARLVRLARLGRYSLAMRSIYEAVASRRYELAVSVVIAVGLMLLSSSALYLFEGHAQPKDFGSIPRALWWSVTTLTTVGYGDAVPITVLGRFFAAMTAVTGIGIIAIPTGILAGAFSDALRKARSRKDAQ